LVFPYTLVRGAPHLNQRLAKTGHLGTSGIVVVFLFFQYKTFVGLIDLVAKQPFANREKDYILQFRFELQKQSSALEIPPVIE